MTEPIPAASLPRDPIDELMADLDARLDAQQLELLTARLAFRVHGRFASQSIYTASEWHLEPARAFSCPTAAAAADARREETGDRQGDDASSSSSSSSSTSSSSSILRRSFFSYLYRIAAIIFFWWFLWLSLGSTRPKNNEGVQLAELGGPLFDMMFCFLFCSLLGSLIGRLLGIPPLLFVFALGILYGNVPSHAALTGGITISVRTFVSRCALAVILLRSGLAMSWKTIQPAAWNIVSMSILPMVVEVIVHGFVAQSLMDYNYSNSTTSSASAASAKTHQTTSTAVWPFLQAMTASPSASAVVGATVLDMRKRGYGITRGPGLLLVPSVILDFTIGIWGISFLAELTFSSSSSSSDRGQFAWSILKGPVQLIVGCVAGIALGILWYLAVGFILFSEAKPISSSSATANSATITSSRKKFLPEFVQNHVRRWSLVMLILVGFCCVFFGYFYNVAGGGCLCCALFAATGHHLLTTPTWVSSLLSNSSEQQNEKGEDDEEDEEEKVEVVDENHIQLKNLLALDLAALWDDVVMYALFSFSGSAIRVDTMFSSSFFPKALACLFTGAAARILVCALCCWSYEEMTVSERVISTVASAGRGSAQVALGGYALTLVQTTLSGGGDADELRFGTQVYDTATLGVLLLGSCSIVLLTRVGPCYWLTDAEHDRLKKEEGQQQQKGEEEDEEEAVVDIREPPSAEAQ